MTKLGKLLTGGVAIALVVIAALLGYRAWEGRRQVETGRGLDRVRAIVHSATPQHPQVMKVLFYGQSISVPAWTDLAIHHLIERYPNVRFVFRNMAIGGFHAGNLQDTTTRDVAAFYPDLIVFHVYGSTRDYERIVRTFRATTAADLILQTDHLGESPDATCNEGFHLTFRKLPYCNGRLYYRPASWDLHMSRDVVPALADRYGAALEQRRGEWAQALAERHLRYTALLADPIHPNAAGWRLMADLFDRFFDAEMAKPAAAPVTDVRDIALKPGGNHFTATGNRIELISDAPIPAATGATIDGQFPGRLAGCWTLSRASAIPDTPWPAIKRITVDPHYLIADDWTATIAHFDRKTHAFAFQVTSRRLGDEGKGTSDADFISRSGIIRIGREQWMLGTAYDLPTLQKARRDYDGLKVTWRQRMLCGNQPPVPLTPGTAEWRRTIATGLANGTHDVAVTIPAGARIVARVYRPPLRD